MGTDHPARKAARPDKNAAAEGVPAEWEKTAEEVGDNRPEVQERVKRRGKGKGLPKETLGARSKAFQKELEKTLTQLTRLLEHSAFAGYPTNVSLTVHTALPEPHGRAKHRRSTPPRSRHFTFGAPQGRFSGAVRDWGIRRQQRKLHDKAVEDAAAAGNPPPVLPATSGTYAGGIAWTVHDFASKAAYESYFRSYRAARKPHVPGNRTTATASHDFLSATRG